MPAKPNTTNLRRCNECGRLISAALDICPFCAPEPPGAWEWRAVRGDLLAIAATLVLLAAMLWAFSRGRLPGEVKVPPHAAQGRTSAASQPARGNAVLLPGAMT